MNVFGSWRRRWIALDSDLPPDLVVARLRENLKPRFRGASGSHLVAGTISDRSMRVYVVQRRRNSWTPVLRAQVRSRPGGGSTVSGSFGWAWSATVVTVAGLAICGFFLFVIAFGVVVYVLDGEWGEAASGLGMAGFIGALVAFHLALVYIGARWGREDERVLRTWLTRRL